MNIIVLIIVVSLHQVLPVGTGNKNVEEFKINRK